MSDQLTSPRSLVFIATAAVIATLGLLLVLGVFDSNGASPAKAVEPVVVVAPSTGGIDQANAQREERLLQHGAVTSTGGATRGDTKYDLAAQQDFRGH